MNFVYVLARGDAALESNKSFVHDRNDFRTAAMMATAALFTSTEADNVTAYAVLDNGTVAEDNFFYAEKG